jgi:NAD(P)-dependent dehydrogenase (short-subunit alcohol dehydrogenase family)
VLVNNVGGSSRRRTVEMSEDVWDAQVDYNLKSVFLTLKHVLPIMERQKQGAVVNVASTSGLRWSGSAQSVTPRPRPAIQLARRRRAICRQGHPREHRGPGATAHADGEARLAKQRTGGDVEALLKSRLERIPLGFMGDGRDTANAALFLASDEARFITGTEVVVDGGMTVRCD